MTRESQAVIDAALRLSTRERAEVLAGKGEFEDWETIREQLRPSS